MTKWTHGCHRVPEWGLPFSVGNPIFLLSAIYCLPAPPTLVSPPPRRSACRGINDSGAILGKRHGRSSGMRHGWRSSWLGVRFLVRLSVQGPAGEVPATAPFSIPPHHRYRRWIGGVSRPHSFFLSRHGVCFTFECIRYVHTGKQKQGTIHSTPASTRSVTGTAVAPPEPHLLLIVLFSGDSNPRLQGGSRLHRRCGTGPKNLLHVS